MGRRALPILIFLVTCAPQFDEEKAREEITSLVATQYQDWFKLTEGSEPDDSTIVDTIPRITAGDSILQRWWHGFDSLGTVVSMTFDRDSLAYVTVYTDRRGTLHFLLSHDTAFTNQEKSTIDQAYRYAIFYKDAIADSWRLQAVTWAEIISDTILHPTVNISEIELGGTVYFDTTLNHLWTLDEIISFTSTDTVVTVKLTTYEDTTAAVAVLYAQGRKRFVPDGKDKNTWIASFKPPTVPGHYRLVINLINRKTFFDAAYPDDSSSWVVDYEVK